MRLFFLFMLSIYSLCLTAQYGKSDSLRAVLETELADSTRARVQNELALSLHYLEPDIAIELCQKTLRYYQQAADLPGQFSAHYYQSMSYFAKEDMSMAIRHGEEALAIAEQLGNEEWRSGIYNLLGLAHNQIGDLERALIRFDSSRSIAERLQDPDRLADAYTYLSLIYSQSDDMDQARNYLLRAEEVLNAAKDTISLAGIYLNLEKVTEDTLERSRILQRATQLSKNASNGFNLISTHFGYGDFLQNTIGDLDSALIMYMVAYNFAWEIQEPVYSTLLCHRIGQIHQQKGRPDSAFFYFQRGLSFPAGKEQNGSRRELYYSLSQLQAQQGELRAAYHNLERALRLSDTIQDQNSNRLLADASARYNLAQKEAEISAGALEIEQERNARNRLLVYGLASLGILTGIFQYFLYRQRRRKREVELALAQEQAEAIRLRELDELKSQFFTNVSHELRTPLTLITSPLEEAIKELRQHGLENKLQLAHRNAQQLLDLTNEILDLAQLEAGQLQLQEEDFFVLPRVSRLLAAFQSQAEIRGIELQLLADELSANYSLHTAPKQLDTIVNNLLANAIKFTPKGGTVSLRTEQADDYFKLKVSDSGPGIALQDLERIFDRFYQSSKTTNPEGGSGIGLALSKQLAELMGGSLLVSSQVGVGSSFELQLPPGKLADPTTAAAVIAPSRTSQAEHPVMLANSPQLGQSILIVEDNPDMSSYLLSSLRADYQCELAGNGRQGLERLREKRFDLILSDVMMPEMDGFAFRAAVNEWEAYRRIPFILLTARSLEADILRGFQLGVDDYITKPFSLPELKARMASLLRNKSVREEEWGAETTQDTDQALLDQAQAYVENQLDDPELNVEALARELNYSTRQLSRVFGSLTGLSPVQFILEIRLQAARRLLERKHYATVAEVRYAVGIESASYFSRKFKERFGRSPGELLKEEG
ncbi:MAG: ATP-binding protein [Bacteroidota bacterium]